MSAPLTSSRLEQPRSGNTRRIGSPRGGLFWGAMGSFGLLYLLLIVSMVAADLQFAGLNDMREALSDPRVRYALNSEPAQLHDLGDSGHVGGCAQRLSAGPDRWPGDRAPLGRSPSVVSTGPDRCDTSSRACLTSPLCYHRWSSASAC